MNGYEEKALGTTTNTRAELNDIFDPIIQNTLNDKAYLYGVIAKEANVGGDYVRFRARTGRNASAVSYGEFDPPTLGNTTRIKISTPIKLAQVGWEVTGLMQKVSSQVGIGDILAEEIKDATFDFQVAISAMLYGDGTGNTGLDLSGLEGLIDDGTDYPTFYGITRSGAPWTQSFYLDKTSTTISLAELRSVFTAVEKAGANKASLIVVTTHEIKDFILGKLEENKQFIGTSARAGFEGLLTFDGVPIYPDHQCPTGYLYVIDTSVITLKVTQAPTLEELAHLKDSRSGFIKMYAELICKQPNHCGKVLAISV